MKNEIEKKILEIIDSEKYAAIGIRLQTDNYETDQPVINQIGDRIENSYDWDDGYSTDNQIDGVCAVDPQTNNGLDIAGALKILEQYKMSGTEQIILIGGDSGYEGNDPREIIIGGATVLAII